MGGFDLDRVGQREIALTTTTDTCIEFLIVFFFLFFIFFFFFNLSFYVPFPG